MQVRNIRIKEKKTLCATYTYDALSLADVVVVDVQCDYHKEALGDCRSGSAEMEAAKRGIFSGPLLAHSYERVMPGRNYVSSIRDFWRVCSGVNEESKTRVARFLSEILNVKEFPLTVLDKPTTTTSSRSRRSRSTSTTPAPSTPPNSCATPCGTWAGRRRRHPAPRRRLPGRRRRHALQRLGADSPPPD